MITTADLHRGLSSSPKTLGNRNVMCDEHASAIYDRISLHPKYYTFGNELKILSDNAEQIAKLAGRNVSFVDIGCGTCRKSALVIKALEVPTAFYALDIDGEVLKAAKTKLEKQFPGLRVETRVADFTQHLPLPKGERMLAMMAGGTIAVYSDADVGNILKNCMESLGQDYALLVSFDTNQDPPVTCSQYTKSGFGEVVLNALAFANRCLGSDFTLDAFSYECRWIEKEKKVEHTLVSQAEQTVTLDDKIYTFKKGEPLRVHHAKKRSVEEFSKIVDNVGGQVKRCFYDSQKFMCFVWIEPKATSD